MATEEDRQHLQQAKRKLYHAHSSGRPQLAAHPRDGPALVQLWKRPFRLEDPGTYHDCNVVAAVKGQGAVHVQQVMLHPEEAVQILWMIAHLLCDGLEAPPAGQGFYKEQLGSPFLVAGIHLCHLPRRGGCGKRKNKIFAASFLVQRPSLSKE